MQKEICKYLSILILHFGRHTRSNHTYTFVEDFVCCRLPIVLASYIVCKELPKYIRFKRVTYSIKSRLTFVSVKILHRLSWNFHQVCFIFFLLIWEFNIDIFRGEPDSIRDLQPSEPFPLYHQVWCFKIIFYDYFLKNSTDYQSAADGHVRRVGIGTLRLSLSIGCRIF